MPQVGGLSIVQFTPNWCSIRIPVTSTIISRRLRLFRHIARADPSQDHSRALQAAINRLPTDWRCRRGRPRRTWLRTIESDRQPTNLGLNSAWLRAQDRSKWRSVVETAMLTAGRATWWWWWWVYVCNLSLGRHNLSLGSCHLVNACIQRKGRHCR